VRRVRFYASSTVAHADRAPKRIPSVDFALAQGSDLGRSETELRQYFLSLLTERRRVMVELGLRAREPGGRSHRTHPAGLRMFLLEERPVASG
jgi:hypothetical protein